MEILHFKVEALCEAHVKKLNSKPPSMPGAFFPKGWPVVGIYGIDNLN